MNFIATMKIYDSCLWGVGAVWGRAKKRVKGGRGLGVSNQGSSPMRRDEPQRTRVGDGWDAEE